MSARDDYPHLVLVHDGSLQRTTGQADRDASKALNEIDVLRSLVADMADRLEDIRSQWGDEYLWAKRQEEIVVDLLDRATVVKP